MDFKELSKEEVEQLSREELFDYLDRKAAWMDQHAKYKKGYGGWEKYARIQKSRQEIANHNKK